MRRQDPYTTPIGLGMIALLIVGLGLAVFWRGGLAFSPGAVSAKDRPGLELESYASHTDFEQQCSLCHQPLQTAQAPLCLSCHTSISGEISAQNGVHGKIQAVDRCAGCHLEHRGRNFDPTTSALPHFDHTTVTFSLIWHQMNYDASPMQCSSCHVSSGQGYAFVPTTCLDCHGQRKPDFMIQHIKDFGSTCVNCHDGRDRMMHFDHAATGFPLAGKHASINCVDCHTQERMASVKISTDHRLTPFSGTPKDCIACHTEPQAHLGLFDRDCSQCHTTSAWSPATLSGKPFDHIQQTGFSLALHGKDYAGNPITCQTCHPSGLDHFNMQSCIDCHTSAKASFMQQHQSQFGTNCLQCHDGADRMRGFDHQRVFVLNGKHASIDCAACHKDQVFKGTPAKCVQCHAEPAIHAGFFGLECQDCHTSMAWSPAPLRQHPFPLQHGGQSEVPCQECHPSKYAEYTCFGCHQHQPDAIAKTHAALKIAAADLNNCATCHPAGTLENSRP